MLRRLSIIFSILTTITIVIMPVALANGSLDTTFDGDGIVTTPVGLSVDYAKAIAIQSDGKIVVAGHSYIGGNYDFALTRYNTNGSLDTTFDGDGKVTTAVGLSDDIAFDLEIQSDGKIVVAGYITIGGNYDFALTRYNTNGSLDTTFDGDGKVTTAVGSANDFAFNLAIQSDGKIVVAGYISIGGTADFALTRYNVDGSLDTTFDGDGIVTTAVGLSDSYAYDLAIQSDGKIVVAGLSYIGGNYDFALTRYNVDGSLDTTFDGDGKVTTAVGSTNDSAFDLEIQSDGKIVVAGHSEKIGGNYDFALTRYIATSEVTDDSAAQAAAAQAAAAQAAAARREAEKKLARSEISDKFKRSEKVTIETFRQAEIAGITKENFEAVNAEILALPEQSRSDITQVLKVARKFEVVGIIASDRVKSINSNSLIEIGLIPADSKHKAALTAAVKKQTLVERSSYQAIQEAIDQEMASIQNRKDRLKKIVSRIASRGNG